MGTNYRQWVARLTQGIGVLKDGLGAGFIGVVHGLMADITAEGASRAVRSPWLTVSDQPDDALALIGKERSLPLYPRETIAQYRARLKSAWSIYQFGGDESSIAGQLQAAGFGLCYTIDPWNGVLTVSGYWSHFTVWIGTHTVTAAGPPYGSFAWGDGSRYGPVGLTLEDANTIRAIIAKWKPVDWICRDIRFDLGGSYAYMGP